jgi:Na+/H+ antiporter NhaD/arsenite permease-like protein
MAWVIPAVLTIAFFVVFRRLAVLRRVPHEWAAIGAAVLVIASSASELATAPPESVRARVYAALLGAMVVVVIVAGTHRLRRT